MNFYQGSLEQIEAFAWANICWKRKFGDTPEQDEAFWRWWRGEGAGKPLPGWLIGASRFSGRWQRE